MKNIQFTHNYQQKHTQTPNSDDKQKKFIAMIDVWHKFEIVAYGFHAILALMYVCDTYAFFNS